MQSSSLEISSILFPHSKPSSSLRVLLLSPQKVVLFGCSYQRRGHWIGASGTRVINCVILSPFVLATKSLPFLLPLFYFILLKCSLRMIQRMIQRGCESIASFSLLFCRPCIIEDDTEDPEEDKEVHLGQLKRFSLRELQVATDNFRNMLGFGTYAKVYSGRLADGSFVAVKLQRERSTHGELQFQGELEVSMAVHHNLLRLRGFCMTPTERLLVYPFMANGSLMSCLRERGVPPLSWPKRIRIAVGAARGLSYLHDHCDPKIIHRDVKAANILLDEDFEAVVGSFSLTKMMDYDTIVAGTNGYIAPEYFSTGKYSEKTDVFGYGIMLLELITGQHASDIVRRANDDDLMLLDWVKGLLREKKLNIIIDPNLRNNFIEIEVESLIQVAFLCTQDSPVERPKMSEVIRMLEGDGLAERWEELQKVEVVRIQNDLVAQQGPTCSSTQTNNLAAIECLNPVDQVVF